MSRKILLRLANDKLDLLQKTLDRLEREVIEMSVELDNLTAEVAEVKGVAQSAVTLIKGLADQIAALKADPVALQALSDDLKATASALGAAIQANTPPVPPSPTPGP